MTKKPEAVSAGPLTKDKLEFLDQIYNRVNQMSGQADTKSGVILSFHSVWAISLLTQLPKFFIDLSTASPLRVAVWLAAIVSLLFFSFWLVLSSYNAFMVLVPRLTRRRSEARAPSLIFFGEIASLAGESVEERARTYADALNQASDETLAHDYIHRICDVSAVVQAKFRHAGRSIRYAMLAFVLWACTLILLILLGVLS
jgi:Flp pilus assembly protein TadB